MSWEITEEQANRFNEIKLPMMAQFSDSLERFLVHGEVLVVWHQEDAITVTHYKGILIPPTEPDESTKQ